MSAAEGGRGPDAGQPPRGGVEGLVFTEDHDGTRTMTYRYRGEEYYMRYTPTENANCYELETRIVTNDGALFEQELCR